MFERTMEILKEEAGEREKKWRKGLFWRRLKDFWDNTWPLFMMMIILIGSLLATIIWAGGQEDIADAKKYQECKQKVGDIEWCVQNVYEIELNK